MRCILLGLLIFLGMLGCKSFRPGDLAGTWTISDASRKSLPAELQNASAKIVLDANGTFVASEMPGLFYFPGRHAARLESGSGVWKLVSQGGGKQVQLNFQEITGWTDALPYGTQLDVSSESLVYFLGDADEGRRIAFKKR